MTPGQYADCPDELTVCEAKVAHQVVVTTLQGPQDRAPPTYLRLRSNSDLVRIMEAMRLGHQSVTVVPLAQSVACTGPASPTRSATDRSAPVFQKPRRKSAPSIVKWSLFAMNNGMNKASGRAFVTTPGVML